MSFLFILITAFSRNVKASFVFVGPLVTLNISVLFFLAVLLRRPKWVSPYSKGIPCFFAQIIL